MSDRGEIVKILVISVVCVVVGFAVTYILFRPAPPTHGVAETELEPVASPSTTVAEAPSPTPTASPIPAGSGYAPAGSPSGWGNPTENPTAAPTATGTTTPMGPPPVPPGRTPEGIAIDGSAAYIKCWDNAGGEHKGDACGRLKLFEKRFATRLYVIDKCKQTHAGKDATGKFSLGIGIDFENTDLTFWSGKSSDLANAATVAKCLRTELKGLPLSNITHQHKKYNVFFTILFGETGKSKPSQSKVTVVSGAKTRKVSQDRVRVRRTPVDGEVIGLISTGNEVQLLKKDGEWCQIITPNNNKGWMICEALSK